MGLSVVGLSVRGLSVVGLSVRGLSVVRLSVVGLSVRGLSVVGLSVVGLVAQPPLVCGSEICVRLQIALENPVCLFYTAHLFFKSQTNFKEMILWV